MENLKHQGATMDKGTQRERTSAWEDLRGLLHTGSIGFGLA